MRENDAFGTCIGSAPTSAVIDCPAAPETKLEELGARLNVIRQSLANIVNRGENLTERLFGPVPRGVAGKADASKPSGRLAELHNEVDGINEAMSRLNDIVNSLERVA